MARFEQIGSGSTKDLYSSAEFPDTLFFEFSDRVSVFDYGALPDAIANKGKNMSRFALKIDEVLCEAGMQTALNRPLSLQLGKMASRIASGAKISGKSSNSILQFIPLEVIFRWSAVPGSSFLKRNPTSKPFEIWKQPLIEFTTKLESQDRLLTLDEARELSGLKSKFSDLVEFSQKVATTLKVFFSSCGLQLWDGKIECALDSRTGQIVMVDALTPDEFRLGLSGLEDVPLSKELLRKWLATSLWSFELQRLKQTRGTDWKRDGLPTPPRLGAWRMRCLSELYSALCETVEGGSAKPVMDWVRASESDSPKVCVPGGGGREAALKWRLEKEGATITEHIHEADAIFVTLDADMQKGLVDDLTKTGSWVFGATRQASELEWSKSFGRSVALEAGIPVPFHTTKLSELDKFVEAPVVKFDGLAAGKGVVVCKNFDEAREAIAKWSKLGEVLLEERLSGVEASLFYAVHSGSAQMKPRFLGSSKDFKRRFAGDSGPNTGGMGAISPHPELSSEDLKLFQQWAEKTCEVMAKRGRPYSGVLYLGVMKDLKMGWHLIEYSARPGDTEPQSLVLLWPDSRLLRSELSLAVRSPSSRSSLEEKSVCLSLVRPEYPEKATKLAPLKDWNFVAPTDGSIQVFKNSVQSGRVAYVVARAETLAEAGDKVFATLVECPWRNELEWRADIV